MSSIYFQNGFQRGFGTWPLQDAVATRTVLTALEIGYRAIDTAQMYGNEAAVGAAFAASGIPRDEICVTTKVDASNFTPDRFLPSVERSLADLRLDRIDVLLLHWPPAGGDVAPSLRLLQSALDRGLARHVGISNYTARMMREAARIIEAQVATNQVEFHPLLNQDVLLATAAETGIPLSSYCSVARGAIFRHPLFGDIGGLYGRSAAQIALRWILQKGVSINTMSSKPENIRANFEVMDFTLSSIDMARIDEMTRLNHRIVSRGAGSSAPDWD